MASNGVNGAFHDDEDIDYSDIEAKYVIQSQTFHRRSNGLGRYQVEYDESFDNILVVDGVPVIDKAKLEKLLQKISKDFSRKGCPIKPDNITVPWNDAAGKSKGCVLPRSRSQSLVWETDRMGLQLPVHGVLQRGRCRPCAPDDERARLRREAHLPDQPLHRL